MKFKIGRSEFLEGLKAVQNIVPSKMMVQVLQNVRLEAIGKELKLTTTDLEISIEKTCDCEVMEQGASTLPVKLLFNVISRVAEGPVEIEIDANDRALISAGKAKFKICGIRELDFPRLPEFKESYEYKINQATFKDMLRKVAYAASQDDTRKTLRGVLMSFKNSKLTLVATDGRRLALIEKEFEFPSSAENELVLPFKTVVELQRLLNGDSELTLRVAQTQVCLKFERQTIYSKLIDDHYPNYAYVIPSDTREHIAVDRQQLIDAIERASVMSISSRDVNSVKLSFINGILKISSSTPDGGEVSDEVPIKYAGEKLDMIYNPAYLIDCLRALDDDEVVFNLNDSHSPAVIKCSIPFLHVLMPLRVS